MVHTLFFIGYVVAFCKISNSGGYIDPGPRRNKNNAASTVKKFIQNPSIWAVIVFGAIESIISFKCTIILRRNAELFQLLRIVFVFTSLQNIREARVPSLCATHLFFSTLHSFAGGHTMRWLETQINEKKVSHALWSIAFDCRPTIASRQSSAPILGIEKNKK